MIWVYKYDENFIWQPGEEILFDEVFLHRILDGYTDIQPPNGLYKAIKPKHGASRPLKSI